MRKPGRRSSQPTDIQISRHLGYWIVLLLCILIVITAADLYLNHVRTQPILISQTVTEPTEQVQQPVQTQASVSANLLPVSTPASTPAIEPQETLTPPSPNEVRIQVLNGCGARGLASKVRQVLRDRGFDVMSFGNADRQNYNKSVVLARLNSPLGLVAARTVAESLGVQESQIRTEVNPSLVDIDVTVILGADHKKLKLRME
ncbi:MAG: LytR C-terminal domain-containing protein [bacterium]